MNVDFKDWLYSSIAQNLTNKKKSKNFKDGICNNQLGQIGSENDKIRKAVADNLEFKKLPRMIESKDRRKVHFLFDTSLPTTVSPFARKYQKFLDGSLEEFETEEKANFQKYVEYLAAGSED